MLCFDGSAGSSSTYRERQLSRVRVIQAERGRWAAVLEPANICIEQQRHRLDIDGGGHLNRIRRQIVLGAAAALAAPRPLRAATYPSRPIRLIVPHGPGSGSDVRARPVAERLGQILGQPVVVENRAGGAGVVGTQSVVRAPADGYTLLFGAVSELGALPAFRDDLPYDPLRDLQPISQTAQGSTVLLVHPAMTARSVAGLVAQARARPDTITCASGGAGSLAHLSLLDFRRLTGTRILHVPYKAAGQAHADVIAGHSDMIFDYFVSMAGFIRGGRLRPLMHSGKLRNAAFPDIPTSAEAGMPEFDLVAWNGLLAPAGTPRLIVAHLHRAFVKVMRSEQMARLVADSGSEVVAGTPEQFAAFIAAYIAKTRRLVRESGATLDG